MIERETTKLTLGKIYKKQNIYPKKKRSISRLQVNTESVYCLFDKKSFFEKQIFLSKQKVNRIFGYFVLYNSFPVCVCVWGGGGGGGGE